MIDNDQNLLLNNNEDDSIYSLIPSKFGYKLYFIRDIHSINEQPYLTEVLIPEILGRKKQ